MTFSMFSLNYITQTLSTMITNLYNGIIFTNLYAIVICFHGVQSNKIIAITTNTHVIPPPPSPPDTHTNKYKFENKKNLNNIKKKHAGTPLISLHEMVKSD